MQESKPLAQQGEVLAVKAPWQKPEVEVLDLGMTNGKITTPGEGGVVSGPS